MPDPLTSNVWITLVAGNTRLHWGLFDALTLLEVRHTPHLVTADDLTALMGSGFSYPDQRRPCSLWVASVVPEQTALCLKSAIPSYVVERSHIPLANLYPTLGLDRAINLLGAKERVGWPALVIDAGTALTFTAGSSQRGSRERIGRAAVYGGAILPGLRLQTRALRNGTAALEKATAYCQTTFEPVASKQMNLPERWANDTEGSIASGLIYGALATLTDTLLDWWQRFPEGKAVLTGGDGPQLHHFLQQKTPEIASRVDLDIDLMFYGMSAYRQSFISKA